jgi:hypothetical protein
MIASVVRVIEDYAATVAITESELVEQSRLPISLLPLNVVSLETALSLELRGKPTLRGHRKSVVRDPCETSAFDDFCGANDC